MVNHLRPTFVAGIRPDRRRRRTEDSDRERAALRARTSMTSGRTTDRIAAMAAPSLDVVRFVSTSD